MTREKCLEIRPGMKCLIAEDFVESPHSAIEEYLGTVQVVEKVEPDGVGWVYFEGMSQPFAFSEIERIEYDVQSIDDENVPYILGDVHLIF